ncbi:MAG: hypothetical protein EOO55_04515 [Hymenobacter sp.]|nr:MAG: hypothetical protein EOO55_04515 [Hymenobacter sp.]
MKVAFLVLFSFLLSSCYERSDGKLVVVNKSRRAIVFAYGERFSDSLTLSPPYAINLNGKPSFTGKEEQAETSNFILPHSEKRMWMFGNWDDIFLDSTFAANKKTSIYILDSDTVRKYSWAEIRRRNLILTKAHYFRQELENQRWRVVYSEDKQSSIK